MNSSCLRNLWENEEIPWDNVTCQNWHMLKKIKVTVPLLNNLNSLS